MATVNDVYREVCDVLLESLPTGLSLGVYTEEQFLGDFREVLWDFLKRSGLVRALINLEIVSGQSQYVAPDCLIDAQEAMQDSFYLSRTTALEMDNLENGWRLASGRPKRWHEDRLPVKTMEVQPKPDRDGGGVVSAAPFYGTWGDTPAPRTVHLTSSVPFYGTFSDIQGPVYFETVVPFFGVVSEMVPIHGNLTLLGTAKPPLRSYALTDRIDILPDTFLPYLKYGVLDHIFSRDGETRDVLRQRYCEARYKEGINLASAISTEALEEEGGS